MKCTNPSCGALIPDASLFCNRCGTKIEQFQTCPNLSCGRSNLPKDACFCPDCGILLSKKTEFKKGELKIPSGFVCVNGGAFMMGGNSYSDEKPIHQVTLSTFYMGKYQVTQRQWKDVMSTNPSYFKGDDLPVEGVSWYDAISYCNALSKKEGYEGCYHINGNSVDYLPSATGYRLPTEAEWEYAARGGNRNDSFLYSGSNILEEVAWYNKNSGNKTHSVGQKKPNSLGLYDMSGNVWEWCWDWKDAYSSSAQVNPLGAATGSDRVDRGGSWGSSAGYCAVSDRLSDSPDDASNYLGFRLVFACSSK